MRLRAKAFLEGRGTQYRPGAEFECSEEEAARLVTIRAAELISDPGEPAVPAGPAPVASEEGATAQPPVSVDLPAYNDVTKAEILEMLGQRIEIDGSLKRTPKKALYQKLMEVWT